MKKEQTPLRITDTTLRDGHQSLWATRMRTQDIIHIIDTIDQVGYYSLEVWGGATFDVCLRFLRENPWDRLRLIKAKAKNTPLQMLLRGQNIVGYKNYPDDLVDRFVETAHENGIDIFRVFDALNDTRNLEAAIRAVKRHGAHAQGALSYTISPVHTVEKYVQYAKEQAALGIDSLCIKDMAGILSPVQSKALVTALRKELSIPIQIHCHATSGMAETAYLEGVKAGAGAVDCAVSIMAGYSSQPAVETVEAIFRETEYQTGLDLDAIRAVNRYFTALTPSRTKAKGHEPPIDAGILEHQIPGGMISNFRSQLEQQGALDKLPEALEEVSLVRKDLGYPPLVTPTSQIVGTQAVMNVLTGERYKMVPDEVKKYVKGMYGRSPAPIDPQFIKRILGKEKPIQYRPADDLEDILPVATRHMNNPGLIQNEEDILSYCIFPEVATEFFKWRALPPATRPKTPAELEHEALTEPTAKPAPVATGEAGGQGPSPLLNPEDYQAINSMLERASGLQLNELTISKGSFNLSLRSGGAASGQGNPGSVASNPGSVASNPGSAAGGASAPGNPPETAPAAGNPTQAASAAKPGGLTIDAVMAGTFYAKPNEQAPPFVAEGSQVKKGQTICILEAMKLFNEIQAPFPCKVIRVLAENGDKVGKGQPLMEVEKLD